MKSTATFFTLFAIIVLALTSFLVAPAAAQTFGTPTPTLVMTPYLPPPEPTPAPPFVWPDMNTNTLIGILVALAATWFNLPGVRAIIVSLTNIGKSIGWVSDGNAPRVYGLLNALLFIGAGVLLIFGPFQIKALDNQLGDIATILVLLGFFVQQIVSGPATAESVKNLRVPLISTSHTPVTVTPLTSHPPDYGTRRTK